MSASREARDRIAFIAADFEPEDGESIAEAVWRKALEYARGVPSIAPATAAELSEDPDMAEPRYRQSRRLAAAQRRFAAIETNAARYEVVRRHFVASGELAMDLITRHLTAPIFDALVDEYRVAPAVEVNP